MKTSSRNAPYSFSLAMMLSLLSGCSGGGFGESIAPPQTKPTTLDTAFKPGRRLVLPEAQPFNVADAQRQSTGEASAESTATDHGTASCQADARNPGTAWAQFQVGQVIHSDQPQPVKVAVTFDCTFKASVDATDMKTPARESVALKVYIQDSDRNMLHKVMLIEQNDALGARQRQGREAHSFNLTLEPRLAYHLILAGRVEAAREEDTPAVSTRIEVENLTIEIAAQ